MFPATDANLKFSTKQKGQGILEVIVTIGIGTIMIMALVVLSIRSNRSSDFSKSSSQASNLAAQGVEILNNLKETNGVDVGNNLFKLDGNCTGSVASSQSWDDLFTIDVSDDSASCGTYGRVGYIVGSPDCPSSQYSCIYFDDSFETNWSVVTIDHHDYTRIVYIADTPVGSSGKSNCNVNAADYQTTKQFTVDVSFTDSGGTHHQTQTACMGRY